MGKNVDNRYNYNNYAGLSFNYVNIEIWLLSIDEHM